MSLPMSKVYEVPCLWESLQLNKNVAPLFVSVPGSKSITNRALLLAALAQGKSTLNGALFSDDSKAFLRCLTALGFEVDADENTCTVHVQGTSGNLPLSSASVNVGSAGTAARFITAFLGVSEGQFHMDASEQMRKRPMGPLLTSLQDLGAVIQHPADGIEGHFPFTICGKGWQKNHLTVDIDTSSQFLSALLIVSCLCPQDVTITTTGTHGMAYIQMTRDMMAQFGVNCKQSAEHTYLVPKGQNYMSRNYDIEPDVSGACYFYAMCLLLGVPVTVRGVYSNSLQGDVEFLSILERMGCEKHETPEGIQLMPPQDGIIKAVDVDMSACSDQAITLAAIAPFANGITTIRGIGHIRHQESDRIHAIATELRKMGIICEETADTLTIYPGTPQPCLVDTYDDHRMAMGFSLIGLRIPGIVIDDPDCCKKTFSNYFELLDTIAASIENR